MIYQVFLLPQIALLIDTTSLGMGKHIGHVSTAAVQRIELDIYIGEIFYNVALTCVKLSVLIFYVRVFTMGQLWFRTSVWILGFLCIGWCVAITFLGCFQCDPPQAAWSLSVKGSCLSQHNIYIGTAVPNVFIDLMLLILPLPIIKSMHAGGGRRIALALIFTMGYWFVPEITALILCKRKINLWQCHSYFHCQSNRDYQFVRDGIRGPDL